jgi:hypothetical protein
MRAVLFITCFAGCGADVCDAFSGQSCIALEVNGDPQSLEVDQLLVSASGAFTLTDAPSPQIARASSVSLPVQLAVLPGNTVGAVTLTVKAHDKGVEVASGMVAGTVVQKQRIALTVTVRSTMAPPIDLGGLAGARDLAGHDLADVPCDTTTQSPCAADQKCVQLGASALCRPAGALPVGAACGGSDDQCARSEQCLSPGGAGGGGVCEQFCGNDSDCKQAPVAVSTTEEASNIGHCLFQLDASQPGSPRVCSVACNPVAMVGSSGCPAKSACSYSANGSIPEFTFCGPVGSVGDGGDCSTAACAAGLSCLAVSTQFHCRPVCRKGTDADCPSTSSETCKPGAAGSSSVMFGYCCPAAGC